MNALTKEMQRALKLDGEKLRQLTGEDHGPWEPPQVTREQIARIVELRAWPTNVHERTDVALAIADTVLALLSAPHVAGGQEAVTRDEAVDRAIAESLVDSIRSDRMKLTRERAVEITLNTFDAFRSPTQEAVPDGWQLVPREPTQDMIIAGLVTGVEIDKPFADRCGPEAKAALLVKNGSHYSTTYRAMLSAAPRLAGERGSAMIDTIAKSRCERCRGDGYYFRLPNGCNPFNMRMPTLVGAMYRVECFECKGTGRTALTDPAAQPGQRGGGG